MVKWEVIAGLGFIEGGSCRYLFLELWGEVAENGEFFFLYEII